MRGQIETPVGVVVVETMGAGVARCGVRLDPTEERYAGDDSRAARAHLEATLEALREYFEGRRRHFDDLSLVDEGTPFQIAVWRALCEIPYGITESYGELAARIGRPTASRAVGAANGANPIGIIRPCHRVIGADGTLTGYGGGLSMKKWLLRHEARVLEAGDSSDQPALHPGPAGRAGRSRSSMRPAAQCELPW